MEPLIDRVVRAFPDVTDRVHPSAYAGTVERPVERLEERLDAAGFTWNPLSAFQYTQFGNRTDGSRVCRPSLFADHKVYVILIEHDEAEVDVQAHEEFNPLRYHRKHLEEVELDRERGAERIKRFLAATDLSVHRESLVRRKVTHLCRRWLKRARFGSAAR